LGSQNQGLEFPGKTLELCRRDWVLLDLGNVGGFINKTFLGVFAPQGIMGQKGRIVWVHNYIRGGGPLCRAVFGKKMVYCGRDKTRVSTEVSHRVRHRGGLNPPGGFPPPWWRTPHTKGGPSFGPPPEGEIAFITPPPKLWRSSVTIRESTRI